jgi:hypothetical protein
MSFRAHFINALKYKLNDRIRDHVSFDADMTVHSRVTQAQSRPLLRGVGVDALVIEAVER